MRGQGKQAKRELICMGNLYGVLGVARSADNAMIKSAFRNLAKTHHPDLHGGNQRSEQYFKEIIRAYKTLGDPGARAIYDAECAKERAQARRRVGRAFATMSASFVLTISSGLLVGIWLLSEGLY
jgi:DnaJ-class molecular chaperone